MRRGNSAQGRPTMELVTPFTSRVWDTLKIQTCHLNTRASGGPSSTLVIMLSSIRNKWRNDGAKPKPRSRCIKPTTYTRTPNKHTTKESFYSLASVSQIWILPNRVTALSTIPIQEALVKRMILGVQSILLPLELPRPRMSRAPSVSTTEWLITVPLKLHHLIWLCRANKDLRVARPHKDSILSSQFTDLAPMACQTLQMIWIMSGSSKQRFTDPKTLCTAHSLLVMAGVKPNRSTKLSKEEQTLILMSLLKNKHWNWLERTRSTSQRESGSTRILRKSSRKWRIQTATLSSLKLNWECTILNPKWARNH